MDSGSEEVYDGREGEGETQAKQDESDGADAADEYRSFAPTRFEDSPGEEPEENGDGGDAGERAGGLVEDEAALEGGRLVGGEGEDCQGK